MEKCANGRTYLTNEYYEGTPETIAVIQQIIRDTVSIKNQNPDGRLRI